MVIKKKSVGLQLIFILSS